MLQINVLYLYALKVELYFNFMRRAVEITNRFDVVNEKYGYYANQLNAAFANLNQVYIKYDPNFYTRQLQEADEKRSFEFRRMREAIRYMSIYSPDEEKKSAAEKLLKITDLYGGSSIAGQSMSAKTTSIVNLIEDFEEKNPADVGLTGIADLLAALKAAQGKFDEIYLSRVDYDAEIDRKAMAEARRLMDEAYRDFVTIINLEAKRDSEGELTDFINTLNVVIAENRTYTGQGQVGSSSGSNAGTDEGGIPVKTATFDFRNGDQVKLKVEVGTVLVAPSNTEGYMWKPEVPELMPAKNLTFREVPIEEREATATFHFFDHTEEEIKQVVGSALTAPANTEGYYWDPAVPATMPEEDTSYYELPVAQEEEGEWYNVTYYNDNGEVITTQRYQVGQTIVPPTPPAGFEWGYLPNIMPARDLNIYPIDPETGA